MFVGFNLKMNACDKQKYELDNYTNEGNDLHRSLTKQVHNELNQYMMPDGSLSASEMEKDWFSQIPADVFLSHSHSDEKLAIGLAGYLWKEYQITCFIDSCVWGYADDLLKIIDEEYCRNPQETDGSYTYNYKTRNRSTSHVHMLLNGALAKMIGRTECLIFLNTPNSIKTEDVTNGAKTASPWIYSELLMATAFPRKVPNRYRRYLAHGDGKVIFENKELQVAYNVPIDKLMMLQLSDFEVAGRRCGRISATSVLDQLYRDKGILKHQV